MALDPRGDCPSPRSITIRLFEDRWGNHRIVIEEGETRLELGVIYRPDPEKKPLERMPFYEHGTLVAIEDALVLVEKANADQ